MDFYLNECILKEKIKNIKKNDPSWEIARNELGQFVKFINNYKSYRSLQSLAWISEHDIVHWLADCIYKENL